jgi:group I intron endonuclease
MGIIYKITSPSGKSYIGQTTRTFEQRMNGHKTSASNPNTKRGCTYLIKAINYHGWDNMTREIVLECKDDELDYHEMRLIKEYNTLSPNGYNLNSGGSFNKVYSEETKKKMSDKAKQRDYSEYKRSDATKDLPMYLGIYGGYPRIHKHVNCYSKRFHDKTKTFEQNMQDALDFLDQLNAGLTVTPKQKILPKNISCHKGVYIVSYSSKAEKKTYRRAFGSKKLTDEEKLQAAVEYLAQVKLNDNVVDPCSTTTKVIGSANGP